MWDRGLLKTNAKQALAGKWLAGVAACLILTILDFVVQKENVIIKWLLSSLTIWRIQYGLLSTLIYFALILLVCPVLSVGVARYFMENRQGKPPIGTIFSVFQDSFVNIALVNFLVQLKIALGYILLIVPGIIWQYRYAMVHYLLAENPSMTCSRAMELSRAMMHGEKWNYFVLELSFIGWWILAALTFGIGALFLQPYIEATQAEFYAAMRAKAFSMGITDENELAGFFTYGE